MAAHASPGGDPPLAGRIAIVGWGSLIWDLDDLAPKVEGPWLMRAGPPLPVEFSRVSPKRKGALALCIDPTDGAPCPTHAIRSRRADIHEAAEDLRQRERAPETGAIGAHCARTGFARSRFGEIAELFAAWCAETGAAGAVWTDLPANFEECVGTPFSLPAAMAYLRSLDGESRDEAELYIASAPRDTATPLRAALEAERRRAASRSAAP